MTKDSDFKQLVRERMRETGQNYTAARADLASGPHRDERWLRAQSEHQVVIDRFIRDGRLVQFPARRKARASVLLHLVSLFQPKTTYPEVRVNDTLHTVVEDHAFWRRELVNYGYLRREAGQYWLATEPPVRPAHMAQEIPLWEAVWLPGHLRGES
ncbi:MULTISPECIES: DUF2087 domain-containing protein [unclassified Luteococcus]|uniref:DUF2087 domain-containing protein n=1 Tax=unclassified Luteococcus TaxID=2639923 RepID=UPI00313B872B